MTTDLLNITKNSGTVSVSWAFGYTNEDYDGIDEDEPEDIENTLDNLYKNYDGLLQVAVLYEFGKTKACHVMELSEIANIKKEFLQPIADNQSAKYFDSHCSCDYEFVSTPVNEKEIHLVITDKNIENDQIVRFDEVISKDEFLQQTDRVFNEINDRVKDLVEDYGQRHNLSTAQKEWLQSGLYEWNSLLSGDWQEMKP